MQKINTVFILIDWPPFYFSIPQKRAMQLERSNYYSSAYLSVSKFNYLENEMEATVEYKPVQGIIT